MGGARPEQRHRAAVGGAGGSGAAAAEVVQPELSQPVPERPGPREPRVGSGTAALPQQFRAEQRGPVDVGLGLGAYESGGPGAGLGEVAVVVQGGGQPVQAALGGGQQLGHRGPGRPQRRASASTTGKARVASTPEQPGGR